MNNVTFYLIYTLALIAVVATGSAISMRSGDRSLISQRMLMAFTVGAVFGLALFHVIPEAWEAFSSPWPVVALLAGGIGVMVMLERSLQQGCCDEQTTRRSTSRVLFLGFAVCALTDGLLLAIGHETSLLLALLILMVVLLHRGPGAVAMATLLSLAGHSRRYTVGFIAVVTLLTPIGIFLGSYWFAHLDPIVAIALETATAGILLHLVWTKMLPMVRSHGQARPHLSSILAMLVGLLMLLGAGWTTSLTDHHHRHDADHAQQDIQLTSQQQQSGIE